LISDEYRNWAALPDSKERLAREERRQQWEAGQKRKEEERRRQEAIRKREERKRRVEEVNRSRLENSAQAWFEARRLRRFIDACELVLTKNQPASPTPGWQQEWLGWARAHADRLDPVTNGFLEAECRRVATSKNESEEETEPSDSSSDSSGEGAIFDRNFPFCIQ